MDLEARLERWEQRQEAMIASLGGMVDVLETIRDSQAALAKWLAQPTGSDLPEVLKQLIASNHEVSTLMLQLGERMNRLPGEVAKAVRNGEARA